MALCSISHCYSKGDIIKRKYDNSFAVITDILDPVVNVLCYCGMRIKVITIRKNTSEYSWILQCQELSPMLLYQETYPLLDVECCSTDEILECNEELVKLSIFIKQGYDVVDCLKLSGYFMNPFSEMIVNSIKKASERNGCYNHCSIVN